MGTTAVITVSFLYIGLLFGIAWYSNRRSKMSGRSLIGPGIYSLSLAIYCTDWTFYGSVGRAATTGLGFLPIYLGPTLLAPIWWLIVRRMIRISKQYSLHSISDFLSARYGKSPLLGAVATLFIVIGIIPYISLQLKGISTSFAILSGTSSSGTAPLFGDTALYLTLGLALFIILFGARHLDSSEKHVGMIIVVAFESVVKLFAFLAVGIFVVFFLFGGVSDLFNRAAEHPEIANLFTFSNDTINYQEWFWLTLLSMFAILFLPRQFHISVVENVDERHVDRAVWLFPLYLLAINLFVIPIAIGGLIFFDGQGVDADTFVLALPMAHGEAWLATFVYIGGLSAASGMVIIATIALSTMISNDLILPLLLKLPIKRLRHSRDLSRLLLMLRRGSILAVLMLSYLYFYFVSDHFALVSIGLVSFAAVSQFAPAMLGGLFWRKGNLQGALIGLLIGFGLWGYTLILPSLTQAGLFSNSILDHGPFGITLLRPLQLFGLDHLSPVSHSIFWSLSANLTAYLFFSLYFPPGAAEHTQASRFVDIYRLSESKEAPRLWRGKAATDDLEQLVERFSGKSGLDSLQRFIKQNGSEDQPRLVEYVEALLAASIGSASARVMVSSSVKEETLDLDEVLGIIDESRRIMAYSRELEEKTEELRRANERLQELDQLKDEFIATVTHELRTPLTSIRAFTELIHDNNELDLEQRQEFLRIVIDETERLTRLINDVLDFQKLESGVATIDLKPLHLSECIEDALESSAQMLRDRHIKTRVELSTLPPVLADRDRVIQVLINLISNAAKFCDEKHGVIEISLKQQGRYALVAIKDNGEGIAKEHLPIVFERFRQIKSQSRGRPGGTGLGLPISRSIIVQHKGEIGVKSNRGEGALFYFTLPLAE